MKKRKVNKNRRRAVFQVEGKSYEVAQESFKNVRGLDNSNLFLSSGELYKVACMVPFYIQPTTAPAALPAKRKHIVLKDCVLMYVGKEFNKEKALFEHKFLDPQGEIVIPWNFVLQRPRDYFVHVPTV